MSENYSRKDDLGYYAFLLLLMAMGFLCLYFSGWREWYRLSKHGVQVTATVRHMETEYYDLSTRSSVGFLHHNVQAYFYEKYRPAIRHEEEYDVSGGLYKRLKTMDPRQFEIVYDPENPKLSAPLGEASGSYFAVLFGLGLIGLGLWGFGQIAKEIFGRKTTP